MSKGFCSSADPTGFLGRRICSGRNLLHFQLKVGVVVWFFPPFCVQLHSIDWCHCFSMYMYLQPQYCVSYSLNINNFCNFKTGGVFDYLLILCFLQLFRVVDWLCQFCDLRSCTGHSFGSLGLWNKRVC